MVCIENDHLKVWIKPKGAELKSLVNKKNKVEHLWDGNPAFWAKSSPALFPIVGSLKNDTYLFNEKTYTLSRHGFARDLLFETESKSSESVIFLLKSNSETLKIYPFDFEFRIKYELIDNRLSVHYAVKNPGQEAMYFSLGGHPAFAIPLDGGKYENYFIEFPDDQNLNVWPLEDGLIQENPIQLPLESKQLKLSKTLFENDALVLKDLKSTSILLGAEASGNFLRFCFEGFPYFGIWAAKNADFVCLEPWCGIADSENHNQELTQKEGINTLAPNQFFERSWSIETLS
jgi:galactose mutarotase-like enzyme